MSGPGPGDHYYRQRDASYTQPNMIPQRRPVAAARDPADVSPPELSYHVQPARTNSSQSRMPQRMGTISSGGKFTVSPASSIHEDDEEAYGYGQQGGLSPSPPRQYQSAAQPQASWGQPTGLWHGQHGNGQTHTSGHNSNTRQPDPPSLWQTPPDDSDIPYPAPPHWRGSRDLQELNEARQREIESGQRPVRTSYGPAPLRPPGPVHTTTTPGNEITPAPPPPPVTSSATPWQSQHPQPRPQPNPTTTANGPFMHYEDLSFFIPAASPAAAAESPKDESQVDAVPVPVPLGVRIPVAGGARADGSGNIPRADTFPAVPENMTDHPRARRSWDRQREEKRRRRGEKKKRNGGGFDETRARGGGGGGVLGCCGEWLPEVVCCLLGVVCFIGVVVVLKVFDGRGLAEWPLGVSINTLVAFLVAVGQVALAVPLTEGLSQLKWNSFARGERRLVDFQTFEDAKRGPVGSAGLLWRRKGRALGMAAATGLLTSFLLSPLTQGAITYPTRSFEAGSGRATVARSESYSHPTPYDRLDSREKQAIQSGIYHAVNQEVPHLQPLCSSGDCEWRNFSSLAVCSAVADVSDRLAISNQTRARNLGVSLGSANNESVHEARLPNGLFLAGSTTSCNLNISWPGASANENGGGDANDGTGSQGESFLPTRTSLAFSDQDGRVSSAIANFFLVYTNQTADQASDSQQQTVFRAAEVLLHFCVNTYQASTARGLSTSRVVHSSTLAAQDGSSSSTLVSVRDAPPRRVVLRAAGGEGVYSVKRDDVKLLNSYVLSLFSGTYSHRYGKAIGGETATSEALGLAMFQREPCDDGEMRAVVRNMTSNVATSLTNTIRAMSSSSATGIVLATESYVQVRWAWLTFMALQLALSISFLLGIMVQTAVWNVKVLKGSPTAALFAISAQDKAYLEDREHVALDSSHKGDEGGEMARKLQSITCRFRPGARGWSLEVGKREDG